MVWGEQSWEQKKTNNWNNNWSNGNGEQSWDQKKTNNWTSARNYVGADRIVGILVDWQHKGGKSFGWIAPLHGLPENLDESAYHGGDVYVHWKDIRDPRPGAVVTFRAYADGQGLGAEDCVNRQVLRFAMPRDSPKALSLPTVESNACAKYLTSSSFYPELEQKGVTLRKYLWDGPLQVYELWGEADAIVDVAEEIGLLKHPDAEMLVSQNMVQHEAPASIRIVPDDVLPNVPPRFRVALALGGDGNRERLLALLR